MASQTEKDTAKAAARTQADTARAAARTQATNARTQADTARAAARTQADTERAKSRQNGGDGGTSERMSQREAAAGLSDTMSGRGQPTPTNMITRAAESLAQYEAELGNIASYAINYDANPVGSSDGEIDFISANNPLTSSNLPGIEIIWNDQSSEYISYTKLMEDYDGEDYWSLALDVSSSQFNKTYTLDDTEDIFETSGDTQTAYRLRLVSNEKRISAYGQYREVILCIKGEPRVSLIKVA
jgi:hypothetical protein